MCAARSRGYRKGSECRSTGVGSGNGNGSGKHSKERRIPNTQEWVPQVRTAGGGQRDVYERREVGWSGATRTLTGSLGWPSAWVVECGFGVASRLVVIVDQGPGSIGAQGHSTTAAFRPLRPLFFSRLLPAKDPFGPAVTQRNAGLGPRTPVTRSTAYQRTASSAPFFFLLSSLLPFPVGQQQQKMLRSKTSSAAWPCPLALPACLLEGAISVASPAICCSVLTASVPSVEPSCRSCPRLRSWSPSSAEGSSDGRQFLPDP